LKQKCAEHSSGGHNSNVMVGQISHITVDCYPCDESLKIRDQSTAVILHIKSIEPVSKQVKTAAISKTVGIILCFLHKTTILSKFELWLGE
jgi:hypothetical protein